MTSTLQERILSLQDTFTDSEQRLAHVTLECLGNIAAWSGADLAKKAGVSKATASRFFRRLGYDNFNEIRAQARDDAERGSPLYEMAGVRPPDASGDALAAHLSTDLQNLAQTFERLDSRDVETTVSLLAQSRRVWIAGFRNGRVLAQYAWALLTQLRDGVTLAPGAGLNLAEDLADMGPDDVLLVMDFRRRVTLLKPVVEHASRIGARVVVLTDPTATELPARADVVLRCVNRSPAVFDSYIAAMSLINHLCSVLARTLGDAARQRLKHIESLHDLYGDLHR
ncbi:MurR/RpiR family transcriptional regulator [Kerstersia gyiorum]|uniref:RpiR family transcriptional regulator n=1 Tax=Kerstersia gyiorum TaxID=206506 RepID=A0A4V2F1E6_9BURK|nr:MurR/RpiR family transcriptional regulator [Kerstersia gyiorum]AZV95649.1 RpiR family transcriptional regulator [Bordetella sp. J329]MCO7635846.1 MurR/RpiR family transcriptional regulator [Pseudomonas sp. S 311-6]KAB0544911.1 MurR/RpiR family transcriptional regulator [Kerstersia gyiorum]MCH4270591.1 MurR/RpiR family transcriptional regulator [Kerstersia gyiorum]MCI1228140.1 MurR/RpiR family transcriptional regulator [Kerstersia gyiorum]